MQDRTPTPGQEGRVLITPEDGGTPFYAKIEMADNPISNGTPLNKETLLQDDTEIALFGDVTNRTVDEAFHGIAEKMNLIMDDVATLTLTVKASNGHAINNVLITGMINEDGGSVYTNSNGVATGYVTEGNVTISISNFADIINYSETFEVVKGQSYTKNWTVNTRNFLKLTSSQNIRFSGNVEQLDITVVGGGGGGSCGSYSNPMGRGGGGGGGGACIVQEDIEFVANTIYPAVVGSGGAGGEGYSSGLLPDNPAYGGNGGSSSILGITANGGAGCNSSNSAAVGNGNGGHYNTSLNGINGSTLGYASFTETTRYGGGGGAGANLRGAAQTYGTGGEGYGGDGGHWSAASEVQATAGTNGFGGGGGGGAGSYSDSSNYHFYSGASGGSGCIAMRMHLASAS